MERRLRKSVPSSPQTVLALSGLFVCGLMLLLSGTIVLFSVHSTLPSLFIHFATGGCSAFSFGWPFPSVSRPPFIDNLWICAAQKHHKMVDWYDPRFIRIEWGHNNASCRHRKHWTSASLIHSTMSKKWINYFINLQWILNWWYFYLCAIGKRRNAL